MNLKGYLPLLAPLLFLTSQAGEVNMDFDTVVVGSGETTIANPWLEEGMKLECFQPTSNAHSDMVVRPSRDTGHISVSAKWSRARLRFTREDGGIFTMKSVYLSPLGNGLNSSVRFTGEKSGGGTVTTTFTTGTAIAGIVRTFPVNFDDVVAVTWEVNNNQTNFGYHQFDELVAEVPPTFTPPASVTVSEGTTHPLLLSFDEPLPANTTLNYNVSGTATIGTDFTGLGSSGSVVIPAGNSSALVNLNINTDKANESPETIEITWSTSSTSVLLPNNNTTITIGDINGSGFPDYVAGHGLVGNDANADADPNGDGISNIEAYTFRLNPAGPVQTNHRERLPKFTTIQPGRSVFPAITWQLPSPWPSDVRFVISQSTDMVNWDELARRSGYGLGSLWTGSATSALTDTGSPTRTITVPGSATMQSKDGIILHLQLTYVPPVGIE